MNNLHDYRIRFLDAEGTFIDEVSLPAESLSVATDCAGTIGTEMGAADFFVTSVSDIQFERDASQISVISDRFRMACLAASRSIKTGSANVPFMAALGSKPGTFEGGCSKTQAVDSVKEGSGNERSIAPPAMITATP